MLYDVTGWSPPQLGRYRQRKLETIDRLGADETGTADAKIERGEPIAALGAEVLKLEKEIAYKEKLDANRP